MDKLKNYVWRDAKLTKNRDEKAVEYRLIDMDQDQLNYAYNHCKHMLYNSDNKNPGRMLILDLIQKQIENCEAELALRWFKTLKDNNGNLLYTNTSLLKDLRAWISSLPQKDENKIYKLKDFVQVPPDYKDVSIELLQEACKDNLGIFDHSKISFSFLFRIGVYFTSKEFDELENFTSGNTLEEKFEILKTQLGLKLDSPIVANPRGLSEQQFRDMIHMKKNKGYQKCKYSELTTSQLETLKDKVLYALESQILKQVNIWTTLMKQIEKVIEYKNYKLF